MVDKIKDIEVFFPVFRNENPMYDSSFVLKNMGSAVVRIVTEGGIEGYGSTYGEPVGEYIEKTLKEELIGKDPLAYEDIWNDMYTAIRSAGRKGIALLAMSAIDIAIWDIRGKILGLPIYRLLGGTKKHIPAYASVGFLSMPDDECVEKAVQYVADGFTTLKVKVGYDMGLNIAADVKRVENVRKAVGSAIDIIVDGLNFVGFIATSAMASVYKGLGLAVTANQNIPINNQAYWKIGSSALFNVIPTPFIILVVLMLVYGFILSKTQLGRNIYMVGGNSQAARLSGLNPKRIRTVLYINCGVISALGGAIVASVMHSGTPTSVLGTELDAITAAVLGGVAFGGGAGSMAGCFVGLLILNCFKSGLTVMNVQAYWNIISQGALLIIALIVDYLNERARVKALKADTLNADSEAGGI